MELAFLGAAREVTGSCTLLKLNGRTVMVDCGMEQGPDLYENQPMPVAAGEVECLFLTHAHIDHSGKIPLLVKNGFKGSIYCTGATMSLCEIMLRDSAHIQMFEAEWRNRKGKRSGSEPYVPLYTTDDVDRAMKLFVPCRYGDEITVADDLKAKFIDAGHLLGSSSIELNVSEGGESKKIVFSGDVGNTNRPLIRDPQYPTTADVVILESTYGDRNHGVRSDHVARLAQILEKTLARGGNVVIPSFAVGRTQEILYYLREIKDRGLVKCNPSFPIYVDSPLAVEATRIFERCPNEYFDEETLKLKSEGKDPIDVPDLRLSVTSDDSKAINANPDPKVIISASGMCEAGRIRHHLKHNLWRKECTVLFVGYQVAGTLGRIIVDGAPSVKMFDERININASIEVLDGISGHADRDGLLKWLEAIPEKPERVYINHGDEASATSFAALLDTEGYKVTVPYNGAEFDLIADTCLKEGNTEKREGAPRFATKRAQSVYERLVGAGNRLMAVISHNKGGANKDLARFADQIAALCDKWDR